MRRIDGFGNNVCIFVVDVMISFALYNVHELVKTAYVVTAAGKDASKRTLYSKK